MSKLILPGDLKHATPEQVKAAQRAAHSATAINPETLLTANLDAGMAMLMDVIQGRAALTRAVLLRVVNMQGLTGHLVANAALGKFRAMTQQPPSEDAKETADAVGSP